MLLVYTHLQKNASGNFQAQCAWRQVQRSVTRGGHQPGSGTRVHDNRYGDEVGVGVGSAVGVGVRRWALRHARCNALRRAACALARRARAAAASCRG